MIPQVPASDPRNDGGGASHSHASPSTRPTSPSWGDHGGGGGHRAVPEQHGGGSNAPSVVSTTAQRRIHPLPPISPQQVPSPLLLALKPVAFAPRTSAFAPRASGLPLTHMTPQVQATANGKAPRQRLTPLPAPGGVPSRQPSPVTLQRGQLPAAPPPPLFGTDWGAMSPPPSAQGEQQDTLPPIPFRRQSEPPLPVSPEGSITHALSSASSSLSEAPPEAAAETPVWGKTRRPSLCKAVSNAAGDDAGGQEGAAAGGAKTKAGGFMRSRTLGPRGDSVADIGGKPAESGKDLYRGFQTMLGGIIAKNNNAQAQDTDTVASLRMLKDKRRAPRTIDEACGRSCVLLFGGFSRSNPFRRVCFAIQTNTFATIFFILVAISNSVYIAAAPSVMVNFNKRKRSDIGNPFGSPESAFDIFCVSVLFFEVLVGCVAYGVISRDKSTWLRISAVHKVDFAALIVSIMEYVAVYFGYTGLNLRAFRFLRVVRSFCQVPSLQGVSTIAESLQAGTSQLTTVLLMLLFFIAAMSVCGMAIFESSFRRRCVLVPQAVPSCASDFTTGWRDTCTEGGMSVDGGGDVFGFADEIGVSNGYPWYSLCKTIKNTSANQYDGEYPFDSISGIYHNCQVQTFLRYGQDAVTQRCVEVENPSFGFIHFDNLGGSMLGLLQVTATDGAAELLNFGLQSEEFSRPITFILFFSVSCLCTFLLLGLIVAVVTGTFKSMREKNGTGFLAEHQLGDLELKKEEKRHQNCHPLVIKREAADEAWAVRLQQLKDQGMGEIEARAQTHQELTEKGVLLKDKEREDSELMWRAHTVMTNVWFVRGMDCIVLFNGVMMGSDQWDAEGWRLTLAAYAYWVCAAFFITEGLIRFSRSGTFARFWANDSNRVEISITILSTIGLWIEEPALARLSSLRLYRLMAYLPTLEDLLRSAVSSAAAFFNLVVFMLVLGLAFVIGARYAFRGDMDGLTRSTFSDFGSGTLTAIQLFLGDSWSNVLFASMRSKESLYGQLFAGMYIIAWFVLAKLIITNLFVAVIIENFEVATTIQHMQKPGYFSILRNSVRNGRKKFIGVFRNTAKSGMFHMQLRTPGQSMEQDTPEHHRLEFFESPDHQAFKTMANLNRQDTMLGKAAKDVMKPTDGPDLTTAAAAVGLTRNHHKALWKKVQAVQRVQGIKTRNQKGANSMMVQKGAKIASVTAESAVIVSNPRSTTHTAAAASFDTVEATSVSAGDSQGHHHGEITPVAQSAELFASMGPGVFASMSGQSSTAVSQPPSVPTTPTHQNSVSSPSGAQKVDTTVDTFAAKAVVSWQSAHAMLSTKMAGGQDDSPDKSLYLFTRENMVRRVFSILDKSKGLEVIVLLSILGSCVILIVTPPANGYSLDAEVMDSATRATWSTVFTVVFTLEFLTRVVSNGLLFGPKAYLQSNWNKVDSVVLAIAWIDEMGVLAGQGQLAKVMRLMRALRPLRLMKRNKGMRLVIDALICTLAPVAYVVVFASLTLVVFALMGMKLFGGKFKRCSTPGAEYPAGRVECSGNHVGLDDGILFPRSWDNPYFSFDSFGQSMLTLFQVSTVQYVDVLYAAMDVTELDRSPSPNYSPGNAVFFVIFLIVGSLFVMNLFLGFIVDGFNVAKGTSRTEVIFSRLVRMLPQYRPRNADHRAPDNALSVIMRRVATSRTFLQFSGLCVTLNVAFMISDHADSTDEFATFMDIQNIIFFAELCGEIAIYVIGYGPMCIFTDVWKMFDVIVAVGTALGYIFNNPRISQFAKAFRLMRVVRLMRMIKPIRIILETLITCLPQLANIIVLLFLVYAMFAVIGVSTFGTTRSGLRLGSTANFETWTRAMTLIYQSVAGDDWAKIMYDCRVQPPYCTETFDSSVPGYDGPDLEFGDCGSIYSALYWVAFKIVFESVMLNLFTGMILENFEFITDEIAEDTDADWSGGASSSQIEELASIFRQHMDAGGKGVQVSKIHQLLCDMPKPIGFWVPFPNADGMRKQSFLSFSSAGNMDSRSRSRSRSGTGMGKVVYGEEERCHERLIIGEISTIVRNKRTRAISGSQESLQGQGVNAFRNRLKQAGFKSGIGGSQGSNPNQPSVMSMSKSINMQHVRKVWQRIKLFMRLKILGEDTSLFHSIVEFETFLTVCVFWRRPDIVPDQIKKARRERVKEAELMAHAQTIGRFFKKVLSKKKRKDMQPLLAVRSAVRGWLNNDPVWGRRREAVTYERAWILQEVGMAWKDGAVPPIRLHQVELKPYELGRNMRLVPHDNALRQDAKLLMLEASGRLDLIGLGSDDTVQDSATPKAGVPEAIQEGSGLSLFSNGSSPRQSPSLAPAPVPTSTPPQFAQKRPEAVRVVTPDPVLPALDDSSGGKPPRHPGTNKFGVTDRRVHPQQQPEREICESDSPKGATKTPSGENTKWGYTDNSPSDQRRGSRHGSIISSSDQRRGSRHGSIISSSDQRRGSRHGSIISSSDQRWGSRHGSIISSSDQRRGSRHGSIISSLSNPLYLGHVPKALGDFFRTANSRIEGENTLDPSNALSGLETFRKRAQTTTIVLKCLDPRTSKLGSMVLADLTAVAWDGWQVVPRKDIAFLEPRCGTVDVTREANGSLVSAVAIPRKAAKKQVSWAGMELFVQGAGGRSPQGSVLDVQAVHTAEGKSVIRINIGGQRMLEARNHHRDFARRMLEKMCCMRMDEDDVEERTVATWDELVDQHAEKVLDSHSLEGAMEVVGYLSALSD